MVTLIRLLRTICHSNHLTSIVRKMLSLPPRKIRFVCSQTTNTSTSILGGGSNPASSFIGTTSKPSLGPTFSYLVDGTLWLAKAKQVLDTDREELYIAEIFKSRKAVLPVYHFLVLYR